MSNNSVPLSPRPYAPDGSKALVEYKSLSSIRDVLTNSTIEPGIKEEVNSLINNWRHNPKSVQPIQDMQRLLESLRKIPSGDKRIGLMNSLIRTLGQPDVLATYLDMLRDSSMRDGTTEQEICKSKLQSLKMHSIYGWCGNTMMIESLDEPTTGTFTPLPGLEEKLGNPTSAWNLTVHIWQPNLSAKGFSVNAEIAPNTILEPPHTHPFDFVSTVVVGNLHQSIYMQSDGNFSDNKENSNDGHYGQTPLEHVDGVWPPHSYRETCNLKTLEHSVLLKAGDSYYMPCDMIHDVEINKNSAVLKPTITLFLSSEYLVMPHVYMSKSMADFHNENPEIKKNGKAISESAWHEKLKAIAAYLRGKTETLDLNKIVNYTGEYAFFHVR